MPATITAPNENDNGLPAAVVPQQNLLETALKAFWTYVYPFRWVYVVSVVLFFIAALIYLKSATPLFRSTCQIHISTNQAHVIRMEGVADPMNQGATFLNTQLLVLKSPQIRQGAFTKLGLTPDQRAIVSAPSVRIVPGTTLVDIIVSSKDRKLAAKVANAIAETYIESISSRKRSISSTGVDLLRSQLDKLTGEHEAAVQKLRDFKSQHGIYDFNSNYTQLTEQLNSIGNQLLAEEIQEAEINALLADIATHREKAVIMLPYLLAGHRSAGGDSDAGGISNNLNYLQRQLLTHEMALPELKGRYGEGNSAIQTHDAVKHMIEKAEEQEIEICLMGLNLRLELLKKHKQQLQTRQKDISDRLHELDRLGGEYKRLDAAVATLAKTMQMLVGRMNEIEITEATNKLDNYSIFINNSASPAGAPYFPVPMRTLATALILALALAAAISFTTLSLNDKVSDPQFVNQFFGGHLPVFGNVPHNTEADKDKDKDKDKKHAVEITQKDLDSERAALEEAFRNIRTSLNLSLATRNSKILAITSAEPGEGKTFTATNLARSYALENRRVLLIDLDLRKPDVNQVLREVLPKDSLKKGASNVLIGDCHIKDVVLHIDSMNLDVVTTGPTPPNPNELLSAGHLREMLEEAQSSYDIVIIDTSPLLAVSDAFLIAREKIPILLVTRLFVTSKGTIQHLAEHLRQVNITPAGLIANCANLPQNSYGHYGHYGYGYGYGYGKYGHKYGKKYGYGYGYGYGHRAKPKDDANAPDKSEKS